MSKNVKLNLTKEKLGEYLRQGLMQKDIAILEGVRRETISIYASKFGLKFFRGNKSGSHRPISDKMKSLTKELLESYVKSGITPKQMCENAKVAWPTIKRAFKIHNIEFIKKPLHKDLTGLKFNKLTVKSLHHINEKNRRFYSCQCDCGNEAIVLSSNLISNSVKSCGCLNKENFDKMRGVSKTGASRIGKIYGKLTVIDYFTKEEKDTLGRNRYFLKCKCECGNIVERSSANLMSAKNRGERQSCGCWQKEIASLNGSTLGTARFKNFKKYNWYFIKNGQNIKCRSGYEVLYANYLTENNIEFNYEEKFFKLSNNKRYLPDFHLVKDDIHVEIKGWDAVKQKENREVFIKDGYKLIELKWKDLIKTCGIKYKNESFTARLAKKANMKREDYTALYMYKNVIPRQLMKQVSPLSQEIVTINILNCP